MRSVNKRASNARASFNSRREFLHKSFVVVTQLFGVSSIGAKAAGKLYSSAPPTECGQLERRASSTARCWGGIRSVRICGIQTYSQQTLRRQ